MKHLKEIDVVTLHDRIPCLASRRTGAWSLVASLGAAIMAAGLASPAVAQGDWELQSPNPAPLKIQPRIGFFGPDRGVMVGLSSPVYPMGDDALTTSDGGATWQIADIANKRHSNMFILDDMHGWVFGSDGGSRTTDGGETWQNLGYVNHANVVKFLTPSFGWIGGNYIASITHDGGQTWHHP